MSYQSSFEEYDSLQLRMNEFVTEVEAKLTEKRANLITNKQNHYIKLNDLKSQEIKLQSDINALLAKQDKTKIQLNDALNNLQTQRLKIDELIKHQDILINNKNQLSNEIADLNQEISSTNDELNKSERNLSYQTTQNLQELIKYEIYLGIKIQVVKIDLIKFIFSNIDSNNYAREFAIELIINDDNYKIGKVEPDLGHDIVGLLEKEFNEHKELVKFLKTSRNLFKDLV
ncbi:chromosome segregation protein Spc25-domain-containing protein [Scheffersomyces amazonensis]|uniref:chromosome segregation protein Spc25-domain-containing protein n=1 Tax=Scheffersomyces amazonensis TaxID=1078765 RepID=UPI00315D8A15